MQQGASMRLQNGVRWPLVALVALVVLVLIGSWLPQRARSQGVSELAASDCAASVGQIRFGDRAGRAGRLLPWGNRDLAPVTARWCRYAESGALVSAHALDAARTAKLAAVLAAPPGGWPKDALEAKQVRSLTAEELRQIQVPGCAVAAPSDLLEFSYPSGSAASVLVRAGSCSDATNGEITVRSPAGINNELASLVSDAVR